MPEDVTENFIHERVLDPAGFVTCRTTDFGGKLPAGVRAKYCQRKAGGWEIQAYLFDRKNWTPEKAREWTSSHKPKQASIKFDTIAEPFVVQGRLFLKVPVMPGGQSLNKWGVTPEARARCASTLLGKLLLGPATDSIPGNPGLCKTCQIDMPHCQPDEGWGEYGRFVDFENNGRTYGIAEITAPDEEVRQAIRDRKIIAVSPSVIPKAGYYDDEGALVVTDYRFDHVLITDRPAFRDLTIDQAMIADAERASEASWRSALQAAFIPSDRWPPDHEGYVDPEHVEQPTPHVGEPNLAMRSVASPGLPNGSGPKPRQDVARYSDNRQPDREKRRDSSKGDGIVGKEDETSEIEQGDKLSSEERGRLSHSDFAYVDTDGKGHLPIHDEAHVRNAMARWNQTQFHSSEAKAAARRKICAAARHYGDLAKGDFCAEQGGSLSSENGCNDCLESKERIQSLEAEVKTLQASLAAMTKWKDDVAVQASTKAAQECADLEIEIGTLQAEKREDRVKELTALGANMLGALGANLKTVASAMAQIPTSGPKTKFEGAGVSVQAATKAGINSYVESRRMEMFGYTRDATGKRVALEV
jgi:hypothetical protein